MVLTHQRFIKAGPAQHLRIQPFHRQEQDAEIGRVRRRQVFVTDVFGFRLDPDFQRFGRRFGPGCIGQFLRFQQALVVLLGKLGVNWQMDYT